MRRRVIFVLLMIGLAAPAVASGQGADRSALTTFESRLAAYAEMHRRLEGPSPPLQAASDMDEVHRLMAALRFKIRAERTGQGQSYLLTPAVVQVIRDRITSCLTIEDIAETSEEIEEHSPAGMTAARVNQPLPDDAPFGMVPPQALRALPPLPPELRYVVLAKALLIWDHHADLVVDLAPGVFDPATYRTGAQSTNRQ